MKEKKRTESSSTPPPATGFGGSGAPLNPNVSVSSGPYAEDLPIAGMTVGEVRKKFADRFDIASKAQAIINGNAAKDDVVLQPGEALMFVQHAGEKGAEEVTIVGNEARFGNRRMSLPDLLQRAGPAISTSPVILPYGIKSVLSQGPITLWVYEQPPRIHQLSWIASDSPKHYGPGTKYRKVRIALPYVIIMALFARDGAGLPSLLCKDECFFRSAPLKSLDDELCYPGLLNCSLWGDGDTALSHPLSWICTQYLKPNDQCSSDNPADRYQGWFEAVRYCLLETSFNLSSEHHEGNSWFSKTKLVDPRIATIEKWEENTKKDPLFVLDVPWIKTYHTVQSYADRVFKQYAPGKGFVQNAADLGRIITNAS